MNNYENGIVEKFEQLLKEGKLDKAELSATMFLDAIKQDFNAKIGIWQSMAKDLAKAKADAFWKNELDLTFRSDLVNNLGEAIEGGFDGKVTWQIVKRKNALTGSDYFTCEEHCKGIGWITMAVTDTKAEACYWRVHYYD